MISKHVHYEAAHDNYGALARYIADAGHEGEKCLVSWSSGCAAEDDYELAILEAQATQSMNTRSQKEKTYHLLVSFRPEDEAKLTPDTFKAIEERFAAALGYTNHQRHCGVHKNTANLHMHVAYNMVYPERYTRHEPFRDYSIRDKLCRELEQEFGLAVDNGREQRQENALTCKAATLEAQTGQESFESYAKRHKDFILKGLSCADGWQDIHKSLATYGLSIKPHGNGLVIKDTHGDHAIKASTLDRALSATRLQEQFGEFQPDTCIDSVQEAFRYQAEPLHRSPERGELFAKYKAGIESRKSKLESIKQQEDEQARAIRQEWKSKRREIEASGINKRNRRNLLTLARKHEAEALAKNRLEAQQQREAIRREIPYTSWQAFLQHEAEQGSEIALAVLRSRKETAESEQAQEQKPPVKNWMERGNAYAASLAVKAEYTEKERVLQEWQDVSASTRKQLQDFLRMEQVTAEASAQGQDLGIIKRHVDGKGVVIFTLPSGGTIRDTGKEIFYSGQDQKTQEVAMRYAGKKWGKQVTVEQGRIIRREQFIENKKEAERKQLREVG